MVGDSHRLPFCRPKTNVFDSTGELKRVLLAPPVFHCGLRIGDFGIAEQDSGRPEAEPQKKLRLYDAFKSAIQHCGIQVVELEPREDLPWQFFTRDFGFNSPWGIVLGRARYSERLQEAAAAEAVLCYTETLLSGVVTQGVVEGGDCFWLDRFTLVVGVGERTSPTGFECLRSFFTQRGVKVIEVPLYARYNHLDMVFQPVRNRSALIFARALPERFLGFLDGRGWELIPVDEAAFGAGAINVLNLGRRRVLSFSGNPVNAVLRDAGCDVVEIAFDAFLRHGAGPHCASFELERFEDEES